MIRSKVNKNDHNRSKIENRLNGCHVPGSETPDGKGVQNANQNPNFFQKTTRQL